MAHFAELDENNVVILVLTVNNEDCLDENGNESEAVGIAHLHYHHGADRRWVQTSYNNNFRCRYAGIGYIYDEDLDVFLSQRQPYPSWSLNEEFDWEPPIPYPDDLTEEQKNNGYFYSWDEENLNWKLSLPQ